LLETLTLDKVVREGVGKGFFPGLGRAVREGFGAGGLWFIPCLSG
jgi:hypothetical protein